MLKTLNKKVAVLLMAIAVGYIYMGSRLPSYPYVPVDSDIVPITLGVLLLLLAIALYVSKPIEGEAEKKPSFTRKDIYLLSTVFILIFLYIWLLETIGFPVITAVFIFFCSLTLGYKKHITNLIVSITVPFSFYYIFTHLLQINLPQGILPF